MLAILAVTILTTLPAVAADRFVDPVSGQDWTACTQSDSPCRTLTYTLQWTTDNDVVHLLSPAGTQAIFNESGLEIVQNLTFRGQGMNRTIIDGGGLDRIITVNGGSLVLERMTLRDGNSTARGGAILVRNGSIRLDRVLLHNHFATYGGAVASAPGTGVVSLLRSKVFDNHATGSGGAIACHGCAGIVVAFSSLSDNLSGGQGGAIYAVNTDVLSSFSYISRNEANDGGAILARKSTTVIADSEIRNNEADAGDGGGVWSSGKLSIQRSLLSHNVASDNGGAVYQFADGAVTSSNSTFSQNSAQAGGGFSIVGNAPNPGASVAISHATFVDNRGAFSGSGHHLAGNWAQLQLDNSVLMLDPVLQLSNSACSTIATLGRHNLIDDGSCGVGQLFNLGAPLGVSPTLGYNGGFTRTHALDPGSNAIDTALTAACVNAATGAALSFDQRGRSRPVDSTGSGVASCDIGAFEKQ